MTPEDILHLILNLPPWVWITIVAHFLILGTVAYLILLERKVASWVQDRIGPNRVGLGFGIIPVIKDWHMFGLGQPLADGLKFIVKEDYKAKGVDGTLFTLAPMVMIIVIIISIAVLPVGGTLVSEKTIDITLPATASRDKALEELHHPTKGGSFNDSDAVYKSSFVSADGQNHQFWRVTYYSPFQMANINIGVLYVLAVLSLAVYGVVIGGWASNNKYSFLGGLRATANMISYEIPMGLAVLCIVLMFGTLDLEKIVGQQAQYWMGIIPAWNVFTQPLAFVMFLICIHAEANRAPFDLAEAEQELVGGYHTEYSSMRFALFFLAEYAGMITTSAVCVALFFGGWHLPGLDNLIVHIQNAIVKGNYYRIDLDPNNPGATNSLIVCVVRAGVMFIKTLVVIFVFMWVRWSLPRFRFDQLMMLAWRALIPISLGLMAMTAIVLYLFPIDTTGPLMIHGWTGWALLIGNVVVLLASAALSTVLPPAPATNRKAAVPGSRFAVTPLPSSNGKPVVA